MGRFWRWKAYGVGSAQCLQSFIRKRFRGETEDSSPGEVLGAMDISWDSVLSMA